MTKKSGEAFTKLLDKKRYSRKKLAKESGVDLSLISRVASGQTTQPTLETLRKLASCLGMTTDELSRVFTDPDYYLKENASDTKSKQQSYFEDILAAWSVNADLIYSAPACAFISGEHAVMFGHPAIYLPLPMRLYIKLEIGHKIEGISINNFKCSHPRGEMNIVNTELIQDYGSCPIEEQKRTLLSLFSLIIKPFLKSEFHGMGFRVSVLSSFPVAVGLASSGALSACIAKALTDEFLDIEKFQIYFELDNQEKQEVAMLLAWAIENCFHGGRSSGAGSTVSFNGRLGRHPILYGISKRSYLFHRHLDGWSPVSISESEQDFRTLSKIKRFIFDPGKRLQNLPDYPEPPPYNITVLYSGVPSRTEVVLKRNVRSYAKESAERVAHVCEMFDQKFKQEEVQRSFAVHRYEIIEKIYLNNQLGNDKSEQMSNAYIELFSEALGSISMGAFNSVVSDWSSVPDLMNSYQALLCGMGLSHPEIESLIGKLKSVSIEEQLRQDQLGSRLGAKITGAGKGGDILVLSLFDKDVHKDLVSKSRQDSHAIHFDSCELPYSEWNSLVPGVRREKLR